jgi:hypothetical protein
MATKLKEVNEIIEVKNGKIDFCILGESPMICNAMSAKVQRDLLFPPRRKTAADKASSLKHDPVAEFRRSVYYARDPNSPTRIVVKAVAFKAAMMSAAVDMPGASKAQMGRLVFVVGDEVPIYGSPELMMAVVRQADMARTPDVRTRAIFPVWAARITVQYAVPLIKETMVINQMSFAGMSQGIGDWRVQKGSGNYGRFKVVSEDNPQYRMLIENGVKTQQDDALANPVAFDSESEELLSWYEAEVLRRGFKVA